jgi:hypothetical protein
MGKIRIIDAITAVLEGSTLKEAAEVIKMDASQLSKKLAQIGNKLADGKFINKNGVA